MMVVLMVVLIIGAIATGAVVIGSNGLLVSRYYERADVLESAAQSGLEKARATVNGDNSLYPADGYTVLEDGVSVQDGAGNTIPGVRRWLYVGPSGQTSGQYGVFGSIVSVVRDDGGGVVVRRQSINQESFAKFAYFTDVEPSNISFGSGDQIFGPVHTNDYLKIYASGATFHSTTTTAKTVQGSQYGTFHQGYEENVAEIPMPPTAELSKLENQADQGGMSISGDTQGGTGEASTRIFFKAIDLNGDGDRTDDNEGFIRVYQSNDTDWVSGNLVTNGGGGGGCAWWMWWCAGGGNDMEDAENCGDFHGDVFYSAASHATLALGHDGEDAVLSADRACLLGGDDRFAENNGFAAQDDYGQWLPWPGQVHPDLAGQPDAQYLWPINRAMNPNFKGVIYVDGKVAVSGELRGQVTLAASNDIVIVDDLVYATNPGAGICADMMGLFSADDIIMTDNYINAPQDPGPGGRRTYDDTKDEFVHGVILALDIFTVENYSSGSDDDEPCEGDPTGRGCLYLTGGIIQRTRGAVGLTSGQGYEKRYSYDACAAQQPPPYFPTTGHFVKGQYYYVDPGGFDIDDYWALLTPSN